MVGVRVRGRQSAGSRRARILLGAPAPNVPDRKRTDTTTSLVMIGEDGNDRLALGFVPDQQVEGRLEPRGTPVVGLVVCDQAGNERGGFGIFDASGNVGIGFDYDRGREAVSLGVAGDGIAAFSINDRRLNGRIVLAFHGDTEASLVKIPDSQPE